MVLGLPELHPWVIADAIHVSHESQIPMAAVLDQLKHSLPITNPIANHTPLVQKLRREGSYRSMALAVVYRSVSSACPSSI